MHFTLPFTPSKTLILASIALAMLALGACAPRRDHRQIQGTWALESLPPEARVFIPPSGQSVPWVSFGPTDPAEDDAGEITGFGGVNRFFGRYRADKGVLAISALGATKMAGPSMLMATERVFIGAVQTSRTWTFDGATLVLIGDVGEARLRKAKEPGEPTEPKQEQEPEAAPASDVPPADAPPAVAPESNVDPDQSE